MSPKGITKEERQRIDAVNSYILNHLHRQFTICELARKAALGEQKFKDGFYQMFEMNAGAYIYEARMNAGRLLLKNTDKSIKEIAALCGYSKARNFSSAYKKFFGVSPGKERS